MKKNYSKKLGSKASTLIILHTKPTTKQSGNLYKFYPWKHGVLLACYYCLFLRNKNYVTKWGSKAPTFINFAYKPNNQTKQEFVQSLSTARWNVFSMLYCLFLRNKYYATEWSSKAGGRGKNHPPRSRHRLMTILGKTEKRA
jgi:hypothetical protein